MSDQQTSFECSNQMSSEDPFQNTNVGIIVKCEPEIESMLDMDDNWDENSSENFDAENKMKHVIYIKSEINDELLDENSLLPADYTDEGEISCEDSKIDISDTVVGLDIDKNGKEKESVISISTNEINQKSDIKNEPVDNNSLILLPEYVDDTLNSSVIANTGKKYQCDICKKCFPRSSALSKHYRIHTGEKPYQCDVCKKCFTTSSTLKNHTLVHTGEKSYQCDVCNKCFARAETLLTHSRVHTGEKPYKCNFCEKCFTKSSTLKKHTRIHTGERPYQCDFCEKCFSTSTVLKKHKSVHTDGKPYQCDICNKCFSRSEYLKVHNRIHTGEKPYQCDVCKKCFRHLKTLKVHSLTHS